MYWFIKRIVCIVASISGIMITLPLWMIAIIGIEISDPGPIFYMANRVGIQNRTFRMFKFRSMKVDRKANENNFKADTNRIFPFGAFLRATKIDELPQLLNCLLGDMAIIGPRPASVDQVEIVRAGEYSKVSKVTPGLSGPSALYDYIYGDTIEDEDQYKQYVLPTRLALDKYYVENGVNVLFDMKMIWWTIQCLFSRSDKKTRRKILHALQNYVMDETTINE